MISNQPFTEDEGQNIGYSTYLNKLTDNIVKRFKRGELPAMPDGAKLIDVTVLQQQGQLGTDGKNTSAYVQDINFIVETRSY